MMRKIGMLFITAASVAALSVCLYTARAEAQVIIGPPAEWLATTTPVYFEGRAVYWYGGRWWYRDGASWAWYHDEPAYLRDWRGHHEPERHYYEGHGDARGGHRR